VPEQFLLDSGKPQGSYDGGIHSEGAATRAGDTLAGNSDRSASPVLTAILFRIRYLNSLDRWPIVLDSLACKYLFYLR